MRSTCRFLAFAFVAALTTLGGASAPPAAWAGDGPEGEALVLTKDTSIHDLLTEVVRRRPGLLIWNPRAKQINEMQVPAGSYPMSAGELLPSLRRLLSFYELALVPMGPKGKETHYVLDARQQGAIIKLKPETVELNEGNLAFYEAQDGLFLSTTIAAPNLESLRDARQALSRVVTQQNIGNVTEVPDAKSFVVTDFAPNVVAIYRLIRQLEASGAKGGSGVQSRLIPVQHANALELASLLLAVMAPRAVEPRPPQPQGGTATPNEGPRITADARTNQLLVRGTAAELEEVQRLLQGLDTPITPPAPVAAYVIPLRRARADRVANLLANLAQASGPLWAAGDGRGPRPAFLGDERTNSLIVSATERAIPAIRELVKQLDQEGDSPK